MTREVRANLIFLVALVLLVTPGFVLLMKKRLSGDTRPNSMPEVAPYQIAYIQPLPAPPRPRKEPRKVREWVRRLLQKHTLGPPAGHRDFLAGDTPSVVSDRFVTQLAGIEPESGGAVRVLLLRWDTARPTPTVAIDTPTAAVQSRSVALEQVDVPRDVRHALQDVGYVDPPQRIWWIDAAFPALPAGDVRAVRLTTDTADGRSTEEILYLGNSATRPSIEVVP